ncbi:Glycosyl transferase, group 1 [Candidatus Methylomirabilis lanthanidiphila]|uniref:Glycosyl transferase, group 1 n=1 Tax=Candidatus Methylomirabilis lanthanidiphila TaxID=2211376 RepID=A0A564ZH52_9BACT|nr:glycosyltransferase [Candidatus Methylomirabilis lanthanidiphila]VUZ84483.1 Glycosyl transferase, group 1 [Candidatus Methylomirabilis lanthanidiphila]
MNICLIGPMHPLRGGIAHYNAQLALELKKRHEIAMISFSRQYPAVLFPGRTQFDPGPPPSGLIAEPLLDSINPVSWLRTGRRIAEIAPDLTVVHWWHPFFGPCLGAAVRVSRRRFGARVIFICHNVVPHEPFPAADSLTRFALATGHAWLVQSETDQRHLELFNLRGPALLAPHPPGQGFGEPIDQEEAKRRLGLTGTILLFFGLIRRYKGLPCLLEAMALVLQQVDCTLLVVGEFYDGKDQCLRLINTLGLASRVRVIDRFIPDDEVSLYFCAADLVVLPYESATQSGIVPIAYAFERPVVVTAVGGLPEAVQDGETGLLVEPRNPTALAAAIIRFFEERLGPAFSRNISQRTRFSWTDLARTLELAANHPATY